MMILDKSAILTGSKMMIAGGLAFLISRFLPWPFNFWSVVTVAAVTRPGLTNTLSKIITRFAGTIIGGIMAYLLTLMAHGNLAIIAVCFFLIISLSGYLALQKSILNYAGIIIGLTVTTILASSLIIGNTSLVMLYRITDVLIGVCSIALVNVLLRIIFPRQEEVIKNLKEQFSIAYQEFIQWRENKTIIKTSLWMALTATLTFIPWVYLQYPGGFWATISCLFIMEESLEGVKRKSWLRFFSHVLAAIVGALSALLFAGNNAGMLFILLISFFFCGCLMVRSKDLSTTGNTIGIALAIMLLADSEQSSLAIVAERFVNVVVGIAVGLLMSYHLQHILARKYVLQKKDTESK